MRLNTTSYKSLAKALSMTAYTVPVEVKKMFQEEEKRRKKKEKQKRERGGGGGGGGERERGCF